MSEVQNVPYHQFVAALAKPGAAIVDSMTPTKAHMLHMAVGVAGEAGELQSAIVDNVYFGNELDRVNMIEELGDVEFYSEGLCQAAGVQVPVVKHPARILSLGAHGALLAVTAGEILDLVKKCVIYNKPLDEEGLMTKLAVLHYEMTCLRFIIRVSHEEVIEANKEKLGVRYSSGSYSDKQAQARADKAEGQ